MGKKKNTKIKVEETKELKKEEVVQETKIEKDDLKKTEKVVEQKNIPDSEEQKSIDKTKLMKTIGIIIGIIALCGLVFFASTQRESKELVHYVQDINAQKYFDLKKGEEKAIILLASPSCGWCQRFRPILNQVSADYELPIYYLNTSELGDDYLTVRSSSPTLSTHFDSYGNPAISTPTTLLVQNGEELDNLDGYVEYDKVIQFLQQNGVIE